MTDTNDAATGGSEQTPIVERSAGGDGPLTAREASRSLVDARRKDNAAAEDSGKVEAPEATAEPPKSVDETDAAPPETEATGETQEADQEAKLPPIERPRSWSKEKEAVWATLDRDTQEYLVEHDREVSKGVRTAQNEAAEKLKGLTAKEQAVEQARQQYETALPILLQNLQTSYAGEFSDIKSMADVECMQTDDFVRFQRWQVHQMKIAQVQQEVTEAQNRAQVEKQTKFSDFVKSETAKLYDKVPELKNDEHRVKLTASVVSMLKDEGFTDQELGELAEGRKDLPFYDHRFRSLMVDAYRWRDAQQKSAAVKAKPLPPVQRPGVAKDKGAAADAQLQNLAKQLDGATGIKAVRLAAQLTAARRAAR